MEEVQGVQVPTGPRSNRPALQSLPWKDPQSDTLDDGLSSNRRTPTETVWHHQTPTERCSHRTSEVDTDVQIYLGLSIPTTTTTTTPTTTPTTTNDAAKDHNTLSGQSPSG